MEPHPIAKIFAPTIFLSLVALSLAFSFGPAQAQEPDTQTPVGTSHAATSR